MKRKLKWIWVSLFILGLVSNGFAQVGLYLGVQGGYSAQKPSLKDVEFNTDTTYLIGLRLGVKLMMIAIELNYFQAAHNIDLTDPLSIDWGGREVDYNYLGLNLKYFFPLLLLQPYLTIGYGYYSADISDIDKDRDGGYNLGVGLELKLGSKFSLLAEGKYHHVNLDINDKKLGLGDFTISGGFNIYF